MFTNRHRYNNRNQRYSFTKTLVNIATIISTVVTCVRLTYYEIISFQVATLIMLGVVIFVALGTHIAKVILAASALFLFVLLYSYGNKEAFNQIMTQLLALIIALIGIYVILRGAYRNKN